LSQTWGVDLSWGIRGYSGGYGSKDIRAEICSGQGVCEIFHK